MGLEPKPLRHNELGIKWNLGTLEHTGCPRLAKIMAQLLPTIPEPTMAIFCSDVIFEDLLTEKIVSGFEPRVSRKTEVKKVSKTSFVVLVVAGLRHAPIVHAPRTSVMRKQMSGARNCSKIMFEKLNVDLGLVD